MSLATSTIATMLPVTDTARAKEFYADRLGLPFEGVSSVGDLQFRLGGGAMLVLLPREAGSQSKSTALSWEVDSVETEMAELEGKGVTFEDYDMPGLKTVNHIAEMGADRAAWFLDPDGNVLCLHTTLAS
ncbi:MAG TPA: VOC family protein [Pedococcus sp.]|jgi:catechol 2,3-dioxygenase-like lactoylglutathione lyase family enzyme|nr:VOC family protein [Pedococcus sp.]